MGLIQCPDCGTEISDQAATCVKCGRPTPAAKHSGMVGCALLTVGIPLTLMGGCNAVSCLGDWGFNKNRALGGGVIAMVMLMIGLPALIVGARRIR